MRNPFTEPILHTPAGSKTAHGTSLNHSDRVIVSYEKGIESRKIQKGHPNGREEVYKENSDFLGEKTNRKEKECKLY